LFRPPPVPSRPIARFALQLPEDDQLGASGVAISPDGASVVYGAASKGTTSLYRRPIDQLEAVSIRGTENGQYPFFSPDGKWIGFFADNALKKVPAEGGRPTTLCPAGLRFGASWGSNGTIVFASNSSPDLMQVSDAGGVPRVAVQAAGFAGTRLNWPHWLPDARTIVFQIGTVDVARVGAYAFDSG